MKDLEKNNKAKTTLRKKIKTAVLRLYAHIWQFIYKIQSRFLKFKVRHASSLAAAVFLAAAFASFCFSSELQKILEPYFTNSPRLSDLKTVLITVGGALIGAGAISFSLVMFAMQVNIERMPHGLFWKFSSDRKIITAFTGIFVLATGIASLSLYADTATVAVSIISAFWASAFIIGLIIYAYRRTLFLINPIRQLTQILDDVRKEMRIWSKGAKRTKPLLKASGEDEGREEDPFKTSHDTSLAVYFQLYPNWTAGATRAINHVISYARRYSEYGDYTVSGNALDVAVEINALYIKTRGKTFFADSLLFKNPFSSDGFINNTLEQLRQTLSIAFSRKDEQQIEQTLHTIAKLVIIYCDIDYSSIQASKQHANLAAAYLSEGVQSAIRHGLTDVVMQGLRWMGNCAVAFLVKSDPNQTTTIIKDIGLISAAGIVSEKTRPITLTGVEQLSTITMYLLQYKNRDIGFAAKQVRNNVSMIAKLLLQLPDAPLASPHSANMAPYYSGTSTDTFMTKLTNLTNALLKADSANEDAQKIFCNIETWSDELYQTEKELLLLAIEKRSHFTFDMIHWIAHVSKLLLALSKADACPDYVREKLERHALWLFSTLSWIKDDKETVSFVENFDMTETLFEMAFEAQQRECFEFSENARKRLIDWAFKAGKHQTGWGVLESSMYALATLALTSESDLEINRLKNTITKHINDTAGLYQEEKDRTARSIRERAETLYRDGHWSSRIEAVMGRQDKDKLENLLKDIANILSPNTANEPVRISFI